MSQSGVFPSFAALPNGILSRVFQTLSVSDVYHAAHACREWSPIGSEEIRRRGKIEIEPTPVAATTTPTSLSRAHSRQMKGQRKENGYVHPPLISWMVQNCSELKAVIIHSLIDPETLDLLISGCPHLTYLDINISCKAILHPSLCQITHFKKTRLETLLLTVEGDTLRNELNEWEPCCWSIVLPDSCSIASLSVEQGKKQYPLIGEWIDFDGRSLRRILPKMTALEQSRWPELIFDRLRMERVVSLQYLRVDFGDVAFDSEAFENLLQSCPELKALILGSDVRVGDLMLQSLAQCCQKLQIAWLEDDTDSRDCFKTDTLRDLYQALKTPEISLHEYFVIITHHEKIQQFSQHAEFCYRDRQKRVKIPAEFSLRHPFMQKFLQFGA